MEGKVCARYAPSPTQNQEQASAGLVVGLDSSAALNLFSDLCILVNMLFFLSPLYSL
jgi:hypothetical protein